MRQKSARITELPCRDGRRYGDVIEQDFRVSPPEARQITAGKSPGVGRFAGCGGRPPALPVWTRCEIIGETRAASTAVP
jgi:hypothetical protein